jgi:hypothetical protein
LRDRGIDVIAYADLNMNGQGFRARPIQLKAASAESFSLDRKCEKFPDILLVYVWHVADAEKAETYALTYDETLAVGREMGYTETESWRRGYYVSNRISRRLRALLEPFRMTPEKWRARIAS